MDLSPGNRFIGQCLLVYIPRFIWRAGVLVTGLVADRRYRAFYFDPATGHEHELAEPRPDKQGRWQAPAAPIFQDWLLAVEES